MTNPGKKCVYRLIGRDTGKAIADVMCLDHETIDDSQNYVITHPVERWKTKEVTNFVAVPLHEDIIVDGKICYTPQNVYEHQAYCKQSLATFWDEYLRISRPHQYKVDLSEELYALKQSLIMADRKVK